MWQPFYLSTRHLKEFRSMHAEFEVAHPEAGTRRVLWPSSFNLAWDILAKAKLREGEKLKAEEDVAPGKKSSKRAKTVEDRLL